MGDRLAADGPAPIAHLFVEEVYVGIDLSGEAYRQAISELILVAVCHNQCIISG